MLKIKDNVKKSKSVKVIGKQKKTVKKAVKVVLTKIQTDLKKDNLPYSRGRILNLIEYFKKNKPSEGKKYFAEVIYKGASSLPQIGTKGQAYIRKYLGFRVIGILAGTNKHVFKTFTLKRIK